MLGKNLFRVVSDLSTNLEMDESRAGLVVSTQM